MWNKFINKIKELGVKGVLMMHVGFLACSLATVIFLSPTHMISGGSTGVSLLLSMIFSNVDYYFFLYAINGVLLIVSLFLLGVEFTVKSIYGSIMLPTFGMLVTLLLNWVKNQFGVDIVSAIYGVDAAFIVIFAFGLMGFGIGINMRLGGSTGGFDILEAIFLKYFHMPYSTSIYILDSVLIISGMVVYQTNIMPNYEVDSLVLKNFLAEGLAATIYIFGQGLVVDMITFGGFNKRAVFIQSSKYEEIRDFIINDMVRGVTYIESEGGYLKEQTKMLVAICYSREYFILRDKVQKIDPQAFLFVTKATEVRGLGFNYETPEHIISRKKVKK